MRTLRYGLFLLILLIGACDSEAPDDDDNGNVGQDPGTFSAAIEGTQTADIDGEAYYGINEEGDLLIILIGQFEGSRRTIILARAGSRLPAEGRIRISEAPSGGISGGDGTFFGFYLDPSGEALRTSDSGAITIVDREEELLEAQFHLTVSFADDSGYLSILGALAAEETDDIDSFVNLEAAAEPGD